MLLQSSPFWYVGYVLRWPWSRWMKSVTKVFRSRNQNILDTNNLGGNTPLIVKINELTYDETLALSDGSRQIGQRHAENL